MKKIFLFIILFFFLSNSSSFASSCKYIWKINKCNEAIKPYLTKDNWFISKGSSIRSIEDFVCLQDVPEDRVFQIVLDENFKKIDDEMDKYFDSLSFSKNLYFWKDAKFTYFDWINHIWEKSSYFKNLYISSCNTIVSESASCIENNYYTLPEEKPSVSINSAIEYLEGSSWDCNKLLNVKMEIFNNVAFNILQLNKAQISKDEKKTYDQKQRNKYNNLADLMMINLSYIERIWMKWPSKIKNAY